MINKAEEKRFAKVLKKPQQTQACVQPDAKNKTAFFNEKQASYDTVVTQWVPVDS